MKITCSFKAPFQRSFRLVAVKQADSSARIETSLRRPDGFGIIRETIAGLDPDTAYFLVAENAQGVPAPLVGKFRTPPAGPHSFSFASASCASNGSNALVFDGIRTRAEAGELDFFIHTGDLHYQGIDTNDESLFHKAYEQVFAPPRQKACWASLPLVYMWDDWDYGPNDTDRDNPARAAAIDAYRRRVPSPPLARSGPDGVLPGDVAPYFSFLRGRVRFIVTDVRSERAEKGEFPSDDPRQVVFRPEQKDWLFDEMLAAAAADQAIIWVNTKPWVAAVSNGSDHWGGYDAARQEVTGFIGANNLNRRIAILSGDMHALAYDDGSSINNPSGLHVMHAAALDAPGSSKGGPYAIGPIRVPSSGSVSQYGIIDITDTAGAGDLNVRFRGISVNRSTGAETTEFDVNFDLGANL
jgi:phosphodiesterase/alkaline phosphatase D-like protein